VKLLLVLTSLNVLPESRKKVLFWLRKATKLSWFVLGIQTCQLKKTNRLVDQILERGTIVIPRKINFRPDTGLVRRGEVEMTPEEVLRQLEKHEESCDKRYEDIQNKLEKLDNRLWWIVGLVVLAPFLQRLL
jgi:hypothetical protein